MDRGVGSVWPIDGANRHVIVGRRRTIGQTAPKEGPPVFAIRASRRPGRGPKIVGRDLSSGSVWAINLLEVVGVRVCEHAICRVLGHMTVVSVLFRVLRSLQ